MRFRDLLNAKRLKNTKHGCERASRWCRSSLLVTYFIVDVIYSNVLETVHFHHNVGGLSRQLGSNELSQHPSKQVRRGGLKSTLGKNNGTRLFCLRLVFLDHTQRPRRFTRAVEIVRAGFSTCLECMFSILRVRPDGGDKYVCLLGQFQEVCIIEAANLDL